MDFLLWACRVLHVFGIVVWLGGLMFQNAIIRPIAQTVDDDDRVIFRKINRRFIPFVWMSIWTVAVTGILMMLFDPRFVWFRYQDSWSILLGFKQAVFVLMVIYAFGHARMLRYLEKPVSNGGFDERAELYLARLRQFRTISIFLGLVGLMLAAGMRP